MTDRVDPHVDHLDEVLGDPNPQHYAYYRAIARLVDLETVAYWLHRARTDRTDLAQQNHPRLLEVHAELCAYRDEFDEKRIDPLRIRLATSDPPWLQRGKRR